MSFLIALKYIGVLVELIAGIIGILYFYKYKYTLLKYFIFIHWYMIINEFFGLFLSDFVDLDNDIIYNIYCTINFSFFFILYRNCIKNSKKKKIILFFLVTYLISILINSFFENYLYELQTIPYIIAASFLIITIFFYFTEILNSEKVLFVNKNLLFWISVGLLLYYIGNIPFRILRNYYISFTDLTVSFLVAFTLTIIMNTCFIIGFIWDNNKQQY